MENEIFKVEHIWSTENDRWIYLERNAEMKIISMNFMQGDAYKEFKDFWCTNNTPLLKFYKEMLHPFSIEEKSVSGIEFVNKCMWAYHYAVSLNDQYN